jgi:hypothetical protein
MSHSSDGKLHLYLLKDTRLIAQRPFNCVRGFGDTFENSCIASVRSDVVFDIVKQYLRRSQRDCHHGTGVVFLII